jgi:hypothetical protein
MDEIHNDLGGTGHTRLLLIIVPTDINAFVPPLHELEGPLLVKVGVLGPYGCFSVFILGETAPFECPLQSKEHVKVADHHVGTVGGVVQANTTEGGTTFDGCCCRVGPRIIQHTRTPVSELLAPSPHHLHRHDVRTMHPH